jgi:uncharacterized protein YqgV (UPF0045/DUF77 family)
VDALIFVKEGGRPVEQLHQEFMVEPFVEGAPGAHVRAAVDAAGAAGLEVDLGPFGSTTSGDADAVAGALSDIARAAFAAGASRLTVHLGLEPTGRPPGSPRLGPGLDLNGALPRMLAAAARGLGAPLDELSREAKQRVVRELDERGAFTLRRSIEDVADALGVSRVTIYNYLDAIRSSGPPEGAGPGTPAPAAR